MKYQFFRIPTASSQSASEELNQFLTSHRVIHLEKNFHSDGAHGYWSFCLEWQEANLATPTTTKPPSQVDFKAILSEAQFKVFSKLRELRKQLGQTEGIPIYAIATNEQLAAMVRGPVTSLSGLQAIPGFGEAKMNRYGKAFLELIVQNLDLIRQSPESLPIPSKGSSDAKSPEDLFD